MRRVLIALVLSTSLALGLSLPPAEAIHDGAGGGYAPFVGRWSHHGFSLEVTAAGTAFAVYRTYAWCSAQQHAGCDRLRGTHLYPGGLWAASLQPPNGPLVSGIIGASADTSLDGTAVRLVRAPHDVLQVTWGAIGHQIHMTLCGPQALASTKTCGA